MIDNEQSFDEVDAVKRKWIAVHFPILVDSALIEQVVHRVMRILRELAAMDIPDGIYGGRSARSGRIRRSRTGTGRAAVGGAK